MNASPKRTSSAGKWTVLVILIVGVAAGLYSSIHWTRLLRSGTDQTREAEESRGVEGTGGGIRGASTARDKAIAELDQLQQTYVDVREQRRLASVLEAVGRFVERHPALPEGYVLLGQVLADDQQYEAGLAALGRALELDPHKPDVQRLAGGLALMLQRLDIADRHLREAIRMEPENPRPRLQLAQVQIGLQAFDEARTTLLAALAMDSSLDEAHSALADLYARWGKLVPALTQAARAIELTEDASESWHSPDGPSPRGKRWAVYVRKQAMLLRRDNRPVEALQILQRLPATQRAEPDTLDEMATCYGMLGQPERAAVLFEQMLMIMPESWRLAASAATWRLRANDIPAAQRHINTIRRIDPTLPILAQLEQELAKASP